MDTELTSRQNGRYHGWLFGVAVWLMPLVAVAVGTRRWLPPLASEHGAGIDRMIAYLLVTVGTLFVVGHLLLGYFVWRSSRARQVTFRLASRKTERRWSLVPVVLMTLIAEGGVFALGLPVWEQFYAAQAPSGAVLVEVTAEQFAWNVRYPGEDGAFGRTDPHLIAIDNPLGLNRNDPAARDDRLLVSELYLPVNAPAHIRLRSKDSLHSFFLPNLRVKQDAVPGMTIDIWFVPTVVGTYELACAELCGLGHYSMHGTLYVVTTEEFEKWRKGNVPQ